MTDPKRTQERHKASPRQFKNIAKIAQDSQWQAQDRCMKDHRWAKTAQDSSKTPLKGARANLKTGLNKPTKACYSPRQPTTHPDKAETGP